MAAEAGLAGVVLSNHGGRQLDFARSGIEILVETMAALRQRDLLKNGFEVHIDGGVRRAGDIIKAVALGATSVGIGRPLLYAYSAYGTEGVGTSSHPAPRCVHADVRCSRCYQHSQGRVRDEVSSFPLLVYESS